MGDIHQNTSPELIPTVSFHRGDLAVFDLGISERVRKHKRDVC
jgi:hypothetical protein